MANAGQISTLANRIHPLRGKMMHLDTEQARRNMIQQQVRCWDVSDPRVLDALQALPREHFVDSAYEALAFADTNLPLTPGGQRRMLTPQLEGRILQALAPQPNESVLEIGTGSGYLTACLARLARHVTSIDASGECVEAATARLNDLGITNLDVQQQNVYERRAADTFDVIAVTGSIPAWDPRFEQWLNPGGRAFIVVGHRPAMEACLATRTADDKITVESLFETVVEPLSVPGDGSRETFRF
jgi:protein-L-isoaspartate(D-aspartate) O-methyltransferase